ncbi:MAG: stage III sporulation protein AD [Thermoflavifilum sp.]|nr:stage III sporulation protein AD [Thermoflavifilum sp.]MCL6514005.1 stage III sporulation protein AD [Alicyclobacillus sp.]
MHVLQLAGIGLVSTVLIVLIRPHAPQIAMLLGLVAGILLLIPVITNITTVISALSDLANAVQLDHGLMATVLKIIGLAYVIEFAAQVARDAQEGALASKIELAGKVGIVILAIPIITDVVQALAHLLP